LLHAFTRHPGVKSPTVIRRARHADHHATQRAAEQILSDQRDGGGAALFANYRRQPHADATQFPDDPLGVK
jgi:hypothetical protein